MPSRRLIVTTVLALLFVVTCVAVVAVLQRGAGEPLGRAIAITTLSSLIAALVLNGVEIIGRVAPQKQPDFDDSGMAARTRPKHAVSQKEWLDLLRTAKTEFYVAGHSLGKWCSASNRDDFTSHIRRILGNGGQVTLVMLDPASPQIARLQNATSIDYSDKIRTSLGVLADLWADLDSSARGRLKLSALRDDPMLPYMVVGNEQRLVTATYLASTDSDAVLTMELELREDAAAVVYDDLHKLAAAGVVPTLPAPTRATSRRRRRRWRPLGR